MTPKLDAQLTNDNASRGLLFSLKSFKYLLINMMPVCYL